MKHINSRRPEQNVNLSRLRRLSSFDEQAMKSASEVNKPDYVSIEQSHWDTGYIVTIHKGHYTIEEPFRDIREARKYAAREARIRRIDYLIEN